jgi:4-amino-4-deoxy-L-arabinose transferase-like glycosyltransferase
LAGAGWANEFYAAAVQAGTQSWKALLFGSFDAGNSITVDKPPAAMWVMGLSGRIFGFSTLSMLVPQALMGVASVGLTYAAVRRVSGYGAGLLAGAALAITPVAALMFRFNNPDALLVLLLVVAAYCVTRALEGSATRWLALAGAALGFAFLTKLMQALLVAPALALVVLVALPGTVRQRIRAVLVGFAAMIMCSGWYLALVSLWPSGSRPYIGGSTDNSLLQLALGYNGLGRVFGGNGNPTGGHGHGPRPGGPLADGLPDHMSGSAMFGGSTGISRLFGDSMGTEISWLLPAALIGLIAGLWLTRKSIRTDRYRAALLSWGGWLLVTGVVFSFMKGIMHPYYTVALAPAVAAVVGMSAWSLWNQREILSARIVLAAMLAATGVWNFVLLDRTPDWMPWLRWVVLVGAVVAGAVLIAGLHRPGRAALAATAAGLLFGLGGTAAYTANTVASGHGGTMPVSGPSESWHVQHSSAGTGFGSAGPDDQSAGNAQVRTILSATDTRWAAATIGSRTASGLELSTGKSVMPIGGFMGGDPSPTLDQFQRYVAQNQVAYFIEVPDKGPAGSRPHDRDSTSSTQIAQWVQQHFTARDIGGVTVYDLRRP